MLVWGRRDSAMVLGKWLGGPATDQAKAADKSTGGAVWMSSVLTPEGLGDRQGTHTKFFNCRWNPASFEIPVEPEEVYQAYRRHREGFALERSEFPNRLPYLMRSDLRSDATYFLQVRSSRFRASLPRPSPASISARAG